MARLNDDAQWIILMGFIVSLSLFFLAIVINQSTVVGQTTAEGVLEFPKNDIRGVRDIIIRSASLDDAEPFRNATTVQSEIQKLSSGRQNALVTQSLETEGEYLFVNIHYNNGVTAFNERYSLP